MTTTFSLNAITVYQLAGVISGVGLSSVRVSPTAPRHGYRVVTARTYHPAGLNGLLMDGAGCFGTSGIDQATWRPLVTRDEANLSDFQSKEDVFTSGFKEESNEVNNWSHGILQFSQSLKLIHCP